MNQSTASLTAYPISIDKAKNGYDYIIRGGLLMANAGDSYTVELNEAMLRWGTHRYTDSRGRVYGEGYLAIPSIYAYNYHLYNGNYTGEQDVLGQNVFNCTSADGYLHCVVKSQGNQCDSNYGKQFSVNDDLKALGDWYSQISATVGDQIKVTFTSPTDVVFEKL